MKLQALGLVDHLPVTLEQEKAILDFSALGIQFHQEDDIKTGRRANRQIVQ